MATPKRKAGVNPHPVGYNFSGPGGGCVQRMPVPSSLILPCIPAVEKDKGTELPVEVTAHNNRHLETLRLRYAQKLIDRAQNLSDNSAHLRKESKQLLQKLHHETENAFENVEDELQKRIDLFDQQIKVLRRTIEGIDENLEKMMHARALTLEQMTSYEEDTGIYHKRNEMRKNRNARENINDPVTTCQDLGLKKLQDNRAHLTASLAAEQKQIDRLQKAKQACEADLQAKIVSRDIDKRCKERAHHAPWSPSTSVPPTTAGAASTNLAGTSTDFGFSSTYSDPLAATGGFSTMTKASKPAEESRMDEDFEKYSEFDDESLRA